ncbi:MAG: dockerin type I domain-containing protein, partial [Candidatus Zixiibacteriota bacterium]
LINNVRQDRTPFFLTAEHCLGGEETWVFMFNYESPTCQNIDGPTWMTVSGSTLLANYSGSDFALLMLDESPPDSYYVYYAGWSNINIASQSSTGIHHPSGDIKKISFDYDSVTSANYLTTSGTTHWRIGSWNDGTTEPGSSGSPLFDQNHHIVGQLHGGYASCTSITSDWYGKFSLSWTGGGSPSTRLRDWLDPYNSGATILDGYDPFETVAISHLPLTDTRDTANDYEVICTIMSSVPLVSDSLLLYYQISSVWNTELLTATGINKQYHAFIPAQSAGTTIDYYLFAKDSANTADTTPVYSFNVLYTPQISVTPMSIAHTLPVDDSTTDYLIIENIGEGFLDYTINIERVMAVNPFYDSLAEADLLAPATRVYPDGFDEDYIDVKGLEDYRVGFTVDKNAGGPDLYGYYWIDSDESGGPVFNWADITATGIDITAGLDDDNFTGPYDIGFDFPFYDSVYTQFYVGSNGLIGFDTTTLKSRTKVSIPTSSPPNAFLAWLWDDLDITNLNNPGGAVYMQSDGQKCIVQFVNYPEYNGSAGDVINAEVIIESDGTITYQYNSIAAGFDAASCAVGIENQDGTDGLEVAYLTTYLKNNLAIRFDRPAQWLSLSKFSGSVWTDLSDTVICTISAAGLDTGLYYSNIVISNNDPDPADTLWPVSVMLTVTDIPPFICGDVNNDEAVNILDVTYLITYLYKGGPAPIPPESADVNNSGNINLLDVTYLITYLYKSGPDPTCP